MLYPVAGSKVFIGGAQEGRGFEGATAARFASETWTEIEEVEFLGGLGTSWRIADLEPPMNLQQVRYVKEFMIGGIVQLVMGNVPVGAGQQRLWSAMRSEENFAFRLVFPPPPAGAQQIRYWVALVGALEEVFDVANSVMKLQVTLHLNSQVVQE
uniref:Phage tail protein n=1 Tax=Cereibacter sphaeroides (strain ATCC 17025 / ATH 2.4.3) TaxID=349102 RepID=A4WS97_CERS5